MKRNHLLIGIAFVVIAAIARLIPHPNNFSPVGSMALFGGAVFVSKYLKYAIPIIALYLSDLLLNNTLYRTWYPNHDGMVFFTDYMVWSYLSFILAVVIGHYVIKQISVRNVLMGAIGFTVVFFTISNFGVFMSGMAGYPKTMTGLIACYSAGIPFIKSSLAGNLVYSTVLFGGYYLLTSQLPKTVKA